MQSKMASKRGRKRKNSHQIDSQEQYQNKRKSKLKKMSKVTKKQGDKRKSEKSIMDKYGLDGSSQSDSNNSDDQHRKKANYITLTIFNADQIFAQILNKANKQPDFLIMLKNLLSGCSRNLSDKKNMFKKKWKQLRNSNCSQDQYLSRQAQLKRAQFEQINQMEKDIMTKLSYANIKGFQTRHSLIQNYKKERIHNISASEIVQIEYQIQQQVWQRYYEQQRRLLNLLMKQNDFVSQDYVPSNLIKTYSQPLKQQTFSAQVFQDNQLGLKFTSIQTQQNPQSTQFLFLKQYQTINFNKVFAQSSCLFRLSQQQKFYIEPKAMSWLMQTKSDQIYTNEKFQKDTYKKYSQLLRDIYNQTHNYKDQEIIEHLLEVGAYVLNSVHYYQKFKLTCDLLHPLDLLLVLEKVRKNRKNQLKTLNADMVDQKLEKITQTMHKALDSANRIIQQQY